MRSLTLILLAITFWSEVWSREVVFRGTVVEIDSTAIKGLFKKTTYKVDTSGYPAMIYAAEDSVQSSAKNNLTSTDIDGHFEFLLDTEQLKKFKFIEIACLGFKKQFYSLPENWRDLQDTVFIFIILAPAQIKPVKVAKPAIYLYPTKEMDVSLKHDFKGKIGTTFPDYNNGWQVTAKPNGELRNKKDDRKYEYLFWDGIYAFPKEHYDFKSGFVVNSKDNVTFLLEKLTYIGLNEKEINDFMVYWLPMLNQNPINFIHFRINDNIDNSSVLKVSPEPDSWIRLFMEFKPVDTSFPVPEQQLKTYPRQGFTLVEWGGGKIEQNFMLQ